jgi:hypothetical protein
MRQAKDGLRPNGTWTIGPGWVVVGLEFACFLNGGRRWHKACCSCAYYLVQLFDCDSCGISAKSNIVFAYRISARLYWAGKYDVQRELYITRLVSGHFYTS